MATDKLAIALLADRTTVSPTEVIKLSVRSPVDPKQLKAVVEFDAGGKGTFTKVRPTEHIWNVAGLPMDIYPVKVTFKDAAGNVLGETKEEISVVPDLNLTIGTAPTLAAGIKEGARVDLTASIIPSGASGPLVDDAMLRKLKLSIKWVTGGASGRLTPSSTDLTKARLDTTDARAGDHTVKAQLVDRTGAVLERSTGEPVESAIDFTIEGRGLEHRDILPVSLKRTAANPSRDQALWVAIRNRARGIAFSGYKDFIDRVLCERPDRALQDTRLERKIGELRSDIYGVAAYDLLQTATEVFLLLNCGVKIASRDLGDGELFNIDDEANRLGEAVPLHEIEQRLRVYLGDNRLPYIRRVLDAAFAADQETDHVHCNGVLRSRASNPCLLELIWSYWHEEGMLVQTLNAISMRFQNQAIGDGADPLAHMELDPLRPLNNLLWGYIQDERNRLTVVRRAYEYDHHYGLALYGKAVPKLQTADSRSKFLEAFHNLLHLATGFFQQDDDTTVISDGFPVLNALKEVHLLLAQGAHNQFGDLPWTARTEMLVQQWLLARPELRDFLQSRPMVPYKEEWMAQVDAMKKLQGWSDVTVTHFHDLAIFGEQILLSIRYGDWIDITDAETAKNWARYWRSDIQGYIHAYRATTGADLTAEPVNSTMPSVLLRERMGSPAAGRPSRPSARIPSVRGNGHLPPTRTAGVSSRNRLAIEREIQ